MSTRFTITEIAQHNRRVAMQTARQHNTPIVGEINLSASDTGLARASLLPGQGHPGVGNAITASHARAFPRIRHQTWTINIEPVPAPRMTRRDKWLKPRRKCVQSYFDYREQLQAAVGDLPTVPDEVHLQFFISMPDSWSKKKMLAMAGKPHRQRPDKDNLVKAILDALFLEDGGIWRGSQEKFWTNNGHPRVELRMSWHASTPNP